jgi:hypothetical protein
VFSTAFGVCWALSILPIAKPAIRTMTLPKRRDAFMPRHERRGNAARA